MDGVARPAGSIAIKTCTLAKQVSFSKQSAAACALSPWAFDFLPQGGHIFGMQGAVCVCVSFDSPVSRDGKPGEAGGGNLSRQALKNRAERGWPAEK